MTQLVEVEVCWPRLRRAALAEMSREGEAAALVRSQGNRAMEAAWEAELILSLAEDTRLRQIPRRAPPAPGRGAGRRMRSCRG